MALRVAIEGYLPWNDTLYSIVQQLRYFLASACHKRDKKYCGNSIGRGSCSHESKHLGWNSHFPFMLPRQEEYTLALYWYRLLRSRLCYRDWGDLEEGVIFDELMGEWIIWRNSGSRVLRGCPRQGNQIILWASLSDMLSSYNLWE